MPQKIRMWEVTEEDNLTEIGDSRINLEARLEKWLESDISILGPNLLVIGKQVSTGFGGTIDLLCLDSNGDLVIVELKRDKAPRSVTAQVLDYASSVRDWGADRIEELWKNYSNSEESLSQAFETKFDEPLPDSLNDSHSSLIVAQVIDDDTERIVRYLSDLNVPINVTTLQYFKDRQDREILAQVFLIEPEAIQEKVNSTSRRKRRLLAAELEEIANEIGVGEIYNSLCEEMSGILYSYVRRNASRGFRGLLSGKWRTYFFAEVTSSSSDKGLELRINGSLLMQGFELSEESLDAMLPQDREKICPNEWKHASEEERKGWIGYRCYINDIDAVRKFASGLKKASTNYHTDSLESS